MRRRHARHPRDLRDLRPALPRRALHDWRCPTRSGAGCSRELELEGPCWRTPAYHAGDGEALLEASKRAGDRGDRGQAARLPPTSPAGARRGWIKIKNVRPQEFVIGGWTPGEGGRGEQAGRAAVGYYEDGDARATPARSAPASPRQTLGTCSARARAARARGPARSTAASRPRAPMFVEPELVARVEFREWTQTRHPAGALVQGPAARTRWTPQVPARGSRVSGPAGYLRRAMPRAIWSGAISFGLVNIPVKLYSAVSRKTVRFHQLDGKDRRAHPQKRVNRAHGRGGPLREHRQGLRDRPRPLRGDHARRARRRSSPRRRARSTSRTSSISTRSTRSTTTTPTTWRPTPAPARPTACCRRDGGDRQGGGRAGGDPHQGVPGGDPARATACWRWRRCCSPTRWSRPTRSRSCPSDGEKTTRARGGHGAAADRLAGRRTSSPSKYQDEYRERVLEMIERKAEGEEIAIEAPEPRSPQEVPDLMAALEASIAASKGQSGGKPPSRRRPEDEAPARRLAPRQEEDRGQEVGASARRGSRSRSRGARSRSPTSTRSSTRRRASPRAR